MGVPDLDDALNRMNSLTKDVILAEGGSVDSLCLGMTFCVFRKRETENAEDLDAISEPATIVLPYGDMDFSRLSKDKDRRIGEIIFAVSGALLGSIQDAVLSIEEKAKGEEDVT